MVKASSSTLPSCLQPLLPSSSCLQHSPPAILPCSHQQPSCSTKMAERIFFGRIPNPLRMESPSVMEHQPKDQEDPVAASQTALAVAGVTFQSRETALSPTALAVAGVTFQPRETAPSPTALAVAGVTFQPRETAPSPTTLAVASIAEDKGTLPGDVRELALAVFRGAIAYEEPDEPPPSVPVVLTLAQRSDGRRKPAHPTYLREKHPLWAQPFTPPASQRRPPPPASQQRPPPPRHQPPRQQLHATTTTTANST
jgi:hypothetical protein